MKRFISRYQGLFLALATSLAVLTLAACNSSSDSNGITIPLVGNPGSYSGDYQASLENNPDVRGAAKDLLFKIDENGKLLGKARLSAWTESKALSGSVNGYGGFSAKSADDSFETSGVINSDGEVSGSWEDTASGAGDVDGAKVEREETDQPKYVIVMVPDGMGISAMTSARMYKYGNPYNTSGDTVFSRLEMEQLPYVGYQRTYSLDSTVTDSAAAGSAWAIGQKVQNGNISCLDLDGDYICDGTRTNEKTVLEAAQDYGMATGLVATSTITHATPAVWGSHVHSRKCESEIFRQFTQVVGVDVLLGGGVGTNSSSRGCTPDGTDAEYVQALVDAAEAFAYTYVNTRDELSAVPEDANRLLGLFSSAGVTGGMTPEYLKSAESTEPSLAEMTTAALKVLEKDEDGFFLMVEGSQIDWANHAKNITYQVKETLAFDDAVKVVRDWIAVDPEREANTLVLVVPDHETGGFSINGPYGSVADAGDSENPLLETSGYVDPDNGSPVYDEDGNAVMLPNIEAGWAWEYGPNSAEHTGGDVVLWTTYQPLGNPIENTDVYNLLVNFFTPAK